MKETAVYGVTHITMILSSATNPTLVANTANLLKSEISIANNLNSSSLGTVFIAGGPTFPAGASVGNMIQVSNLPGLAYTIQGPAPYYIGVAGLTTTVQIVQSLSNIGGATFR